MGRVLGIVYRCIATHLIKKAGFSRKTARTGAITLIQRFGGALNLNVHFHMLFLDGVYVARPDGSLRFRWVKAPSSAELDRLTQTLAQRIFEGKNRYPGNSSRYDNCSLEWLKKLCMTSMVGQ